MKTLRFVEDFQFQNLVQTSSGCTVLTLCIPLTKNKAGNFFSAYWPPIKNFQFFRNNRNTVFPKITDFWFYQTKLFHFVCSPTQFMFLQLFLYHTHSKQLFPQFWVVIKMQVTQELKSWKSSKLFWIYLNTNYVTLKFHIKASF